MNTNGDHNTFLGNSAGGTNKTGKNNTYSGASAGQSNQTGENNAFYGAMSGLNNTGSNNVFLGCQAGYKNTGSNNVFIGYYADKTGNYSNKLIISNSNTTSPLIYGEFDNKILKFNANVLPSSTYSSYYGTGNDLGSSDNRWRTLYAGNLNLSDNLTISGNLNVTGNVSKSLIPLQGSENLGSEDNEWNNTYTYNLNVSGKVGTSLSPSSSGSYNLGSSSYRWGSVYATTLNFSKVSCDMIPNTANYYSIGASNSRWFEVYANYIWANKKAEFSSSEEQKTLYVSNTTTSNSTIQGIKVYTTGGTSANYAIYANAYTSGITNYGVYGEADKAGATNNYGVKGLATGGTSYNYAVYGIATGSNTGSNYGLYGEAANGANNYAVYATGNIRYTGGCSKDSDKRLKKDIQTIDGALDKVLKLRGVTYYWKNREEMAAAKGLPADSLRYGYEQGKQIGVIAQEIEEVFPELVETDSEGFKAVDYVSIAPILIEAIKELKAEKDELKAEKDALEAKVEKLEAQMQQILEKLGK